MSKQQITGIIIVVALVAGALGYAIGAGSVGQTLGGLTRPDDNVAPADTNFISGEVKSVDGNIVILKTLTADPNDKAPEEREVTVNSDTKIFRQEARPAETLKKEQEAHAKRIAAWDSTSGDPMPFPPRQYNEKEIVLSDIQPGERVMVEAAMPIRLVEKFDAVRITVEYNAFPVVPPPANLPPPPAAQ